MKYMAEARRVINKKIIFLRILMCYNFGYERLYNNVRVRKNIHICTIWCSTNPRREGVGEGGLILGQRKSLKFYVKSSL